MSGADADDDGEWSCEFESWDKNGVRGDGHIAKVKIYNIVCLSPPQKITKGVLGGNFQNLMADLR